jgi:NDP-sugar pyrophosphorylase family protein
MLSTLLTMSNSYGFILAAGEGRRMRPATLTTPKALLPFCGVPLLEVTASAMASLPGIRGIVVNACYLGGQVQDACRRLDGVNGIPVSCSMEEKLLNHGGGIRKGIEGMAADADEILVHNVDIVHDFPLGRLLEIHRNHPENAATLLLIREARGVTVAPDGTIDSFHAADAPESFTFSGVYVIKREILDFLPPGQEAPSILDAFKAAAAAGRRIAAVIADEGTFWSDVGSADEYIRAHGTIVSLGGRTPLHLQAPAGAKGLFHQKEAVPPEQEQGGGVRQKELHPPQVCDGVFRR